MTDPVALIHQQESLFHDAWAQSTDVASVTVRETFEAETALENRFILKLMGPLAGKRILDVGAGLGESSVYFALQGAQVTCTDISPGMVDFARRLAHHHGVEIEGLVMAGERFLTRENDYDYVYIANTIHHVVDRLSLFAQIHRALRPGGQFFSWDPVAYNPVINVYRHMATEVRTEDETPLRAADVRLARQFFPDTRHREFWIAALSLFLKYYLFDRVGPNDDRYWKRIFRETPQSLRWWRPLLALDGLLTRLPAIHWLAWNMVMWGTKP